MQLFSWFQPTRLHAAVSHGMAQVTCSKLGDPEPIRRLWIFAPASNDDDSQRKQALKTLTKKPFTQHHSYTLRRCELLSCENPVIYKNICLAYRIKHGLAPPPLSAFIKFKSSAARASRGATKNDCATPFRKTTFSQGVFALAASHQRDTATQSIRWSPLYHSFNANTKDGPVDFQQCEHEYAYDYYCW